MIRLTILLEDDTKLISGLSVKYAIKTGKIRHGGWPIIVGASSLAYVVAKIGYIFGQNCTDKFLVQAPTSDISTQIRKNREKDKVRWGTKHDDQLRKFSEILDEVEWESISDVEKQIMDDCNSVAFWKFSMPLMISLSGAVYLAIKRGFLGSSKWNKSMPKAPKMIMGASVGYVAGQYLYLYSKDCSNRFLQFAPNDKIARILRQDESLLTESPSYHQSDDSVLVSAVSSETDQGYVIPEYGSENIDKSIRDSLHN